MHVVQLFLGYSTFMPDDKTDKANRSDDALDDSLRLRVALLLACMELTGGEDLLEAWDLAEEFYDAAPELLEKLNEQGLSNLPAGPGQFLEFLSKQAENN